MTRRHWLLATSLGILFLLVIAAVSFPDMAVRRILFIAVIGAGIVVLIAYAFKGESDRADMEDALEVQSALLKDLRTDVNNLLKRHHRQLAVDLGQQTDGGMDVDEALRMMVAGATPKEG